MRHAPAQDFPGSPNHPIGNRIKLRLAVPRQIRALGQELAHQAIGVLIDASSPWAVRIAEIHRYPRMGAELLVAYLFAPVTRPCIAIKPLADRTLVSPDFDQVALPVFRELAIHNLERAHMDALQIGSAPTAILPPLTRSRRLGRVPCADRQRVPCAALPGVGCRCLATDRLRNLTRPVYR